jgi:hypothetical protein
MGLHNNSVIEWPPAPLPVPEIADELAEQGTFFTNIGEKKRSLHHEDYLQPVFSE